MERKGDSSVYIFVERVLAIRSSMGEWADSV